VNFFEHQRLARRNSRRLLILFTLAVTIIVTVMALVGWGLGSSMGARSGGANSQANYDVFFAWTFGLTAFTVIVASSLYRIFQLRHGGDVVAVEMGGTLVPEETKDPELRRLRNVTEEIAIASGVPVPHLYVLEEDLSINAFAAGYAAEDAAVAVTRGTLLRLNRDELQAVIAHEFSHVLNGDMRLNIRLIGVVYGILAISLIGKKMLVAATGWGSPVREVDRWRDRNRSSTTRGVGVSVTVFLLVTGLACIIVGSLGAFFARLIKAAISRQREYLADASAVQFTRQKEPLAGALKKIGGLEVGSRLKNQAAAEEISHMLFGAGSSMADWLSTHPPIIERIQRLEPRFRPQKLEKLRKTWAGQVPNGLDEDRALGLARPDENPMASTPALTQPPVLPPPLPSYQPPPPPLPTAERAGAPNQADYQQAKALFSQLPAALLERAHQRDYAQPLLLTLLMMDNKTNTDQHHLIDEHLGFDIAWQVRDLSVGLLRDLHPGLRLPLAGVIFPVLRHLPKTQLQAFMRCMNALIHSDGRVSLFEYCFSCLIQAQIQAALKPSLQRPFGQRKLPQVRKELAVLINMVAWAGNPDDFARAQQAALAGWNTLFAREHITYALPQTGVQVLDTIWPKLNELEPMSKQLLIEAVTATISSRPPVTVAEAELLRTLCGVLHCPLPPRFRVMA